MTEVVPGAVVGGFRIESVVGRGAMAEVYRAIDGSGHVVALKILDRLLAGDERFRQRFLRESQLASSLHHPNIVSTVGSGEDAGHLYLAMEYVEGTDLRQLLRSEGRLEPERALALIDQVAGALDAAHSAGLVHRDVKPGNILVQAQSEGEHAYVCDFGLARHVSSVSSLTGDRGFVGTIDYVPPEQIEGGRVDRRADVYSLGCVLFECLAGIRPFDRDSELSVVFAHLNEPPPRLTDARPDLPAAFDEVFATALAKNPDDRYSSCGELAKAARAAQHGRVLGRRKPRERRLAAAAALLAAAAVPTAILLTEKSGGRGPTTITPNSILGARLGDSNELISQLWGGGQKLGMQTPPDYSVLTQRTRNVSAYFVGTNDKAVEITTWNNADRTAAGIGPCSTLADLRRAYGKKLRPSPHNTHGNLVFVWLVGKHLLFSMGPIDAPTTVQAVGIHSNDLAAAGYNVANDGPCAPAADDSRVTRPTAIPGNTTPKRTTIVSRQFNPRLTIQAPVGWKLESDTKESLRLGSRAGVRMDFALDPSASAEGALLNDVSGTPQGLTSWLRANRLLVVSAPRTVLLGHPALTVTALDVAASRRVPAGGTTYLGFPDPTVRFPTHIARGGAVRLYLTLVRLGSVVHTLVVAVTGLSARQLRSAAKVAEGIVFDLQVRGAPVSPLSPLSSMCTPVFYGSCVGELTAGTHHSSTFKPAITYTVPLGWTNFTDHPGVFGLVPPHSDWEAVDNGLSDYIDAVTSITTGNGRCADGHGTARTPQAFLRWIRQEPGFASIRPRRVTIGGLSGYVVDLRMRESFAASCPWSQGQPAQQVLTGLPPSPDELNHGLLPQPMTMRLYLLRYKRGTLGIEIDAVRDPRRLSAYSKIVESFRFALS